MARIHNGKAWTEVLPDNEPSIDQKKRKNALFRRRSQLSSDNKDTSPVAPVLDGNGKILVTIPSFRGAHEVHCMHENITTVEILTLVSVLNLYFQMATIVAQPC